MSTAIKKTLTVEEKHEYIVNYRQFVKLIARKLAFNLPSHIEADDLIQDGLLGLMDALDRYDPSRGHSFHSFAARRVRGAMLDAIRTQDWVSRGGRKRSRDMHAAQEQLQGALGRTPSSEELADAVGISMRELHRRQAEKGRLTLVQLDQSQSQSEHPIHVLADDSVPVEEQFLGREWGYEVKAALRGLSERERLVIYKYYYEQWNIRSIGNLLGVSEARISQIHTRCLRKLKEHFAYRAAC